MDRVKALKILSNFLLLFFSAGFVSADGNYFIGRDEGGVYFQTDQDGSWYIVEEDLRYFKIGDRGTYAVKRDKNGTFIVTEKNRKFYLDIDARDKLEHKITKFNREQHQKIVKETKVIIKGNQVLVPVTLGYHETEIESMLLLDTGASIITLHRSAVNKLNIKNTRKVAISVVGGSKIKADLAKLDYVRVGPKVKENIYIGIIDYKGNELDHQGLLGMNFLMGIDYHIDYKRRVISWK